VGVGVGVEVGSGVGVGVGVGVAVGVEAGSGVGVGVGVGVAVGVEAGSGVGVGVVVGFTDRLQLSVRKPTRRSKGARKQLLRFRSMVKNSFKTSTTRLPSRPESGSGAAQARRRSGPVPDRESKPTDGPNLILEQLCWVPTETCSSRIGPDRSRSSRPALRWKTRMPLHTLRRPVIRFGSLRRTQDTDRLWVQASLSVTLTQSSAHNSESISN
jgi:hypothetical protein